MSNMHTGMTIRNLENTVILAEKKNNVIQFPPRELKEAADTYGIGSMFDEIFAPLPDFIKDGQ